ncbi:hypothetical protein LQF76_10995 [Gloeomargaritales cyanobacterium VI4D9]|nr:hypothetical protein LQF76_10995 [Gloeomargaritales cyanobacterium VI4D9]
MIALEIEKIYAQEAKQRQVEAGKKNLEKFKTNISLVRTLASEPEEQVKGRLRNTSSEQERTSATRAAKVVGVGSTAVKQSMTTQKLKPILY